MRTLRLAALVLSASLLSAVPVDACSVIPSYRVPTNFELTERAHVILLGVVEGHAPGATEHDLGEVIVRPITLVKGEALPAEVRIEGLVKGEALPAEVRIEGQLSDDPRLVVASDPRDLLNPNPGALIGFCTRYIFRRGMTLLLFLERSNQGQLRLAGYPFARSAEDVASEQAPWVRAVRLYAEVAALPEAERRAALTARRDALRATTDDPDATLLAEDVDRQLQRRRIPPYD